MEGVRLVTYAGDLTPEQAWQRLAEDPGAVLVDCRTQPEWEFVGVPDLSELGKQTVLVEWQTYPTGAVNSAFVDQLRARGVTADHPVIFLCRSGQRSISAAEAATAAGLEPSYNILEGFEGPVDARGHRGSIGWRARDLPWRQ